jgi:hypothetical protein
MADSRKRIVEAPRKRRSPELQQVRVLVLPDPDPDPSYLDQEEFTDRREAYRRGDLAFVGIRAEAKIVVDGILQTIVSGGLWGVESDAGDAYIREVAGEEYTDLRRILKTLGVPTSDLPNDVDPSWIEWRTE